MVERSYSCGGFVSCLVRGRGGGVEKGVGTRRLRQNSASHDLHQICKLVRVVTSSRHPSTLIHCVHARWDRMRSLATASSRTRHLPSAKISSVAVDVDEDLVFVVSEIQNPDADVELGVYRVNVRDDKEVRVYVPMILPLLS